MAVANTKSTIVTNADASPRAMTPAILSAGRIKEDVAKVEVLAADDDNSVYRLFRVNSKDRVSEILIRNDAITGGTAYDLGLYDTAARGGAVVSGQLWGSAIDMSSARTTSPLFAVFEALNIDDQHKTIWELLGLSADPGLDYDIALKGTTVGTGAGGIAAKLWRALGD